MNEINCDVLNIILSYIDNVKQLNIVRKNLHLNVTIYMYKNYYYRIINKENQYFIENIYFDDIINLSKLKSCKKIIFCYYFNQYIHKAIPNIVTHLSIRTIKIDEIIIPSSVTYK